MNFKKSGVFFYYSRVQNVKTQRNVRLQVLLITRVLKTPRDDVHRLRSGPVVLSRTSCVRTTLTRARDLLTRKHWRRGKSVLHTRTG